jgi:hypothetical protein
MRNLVLIPLAVVTAALPSRARAELELQPWLAVTVEELVDSNVLNSQGVDVVSRLSPRIGLLARGERGGVVAEYGVAFHGYALGKAGDSVNHRGSVEGRWSPTRRWRLGGRTVIIAADDPVLLDRAGVAIPQGGVLDATGDLTTSFALTRRLALEAEGGLRWSRFELADDAALALDGDEQRLLAGPTYRLTRRLTAGARARWHRFVTYRDDGEEIQHAGGATAAASWRATRTLRLRGEAGPFWMAGEASALVMGQAVWTGRRSRVTLTGSRELYGGTGADAAVRSDSVRLDLAWLATRRLVFRLRGGAYRSVDAVGGDPRGSGLHARAELGWRSSRGGWEVDLYAEHRAQDGAGGFAFDDIRRTLIGVRISAIMGTDFLSIEETR